MLIRSEIHSSHTLVLIGDTAFWSGVEFNRQGEHITIISVNNVLVIIMVLLECRQKWPVCIRDFAAIEKRMLAKSRGGGRAAEAAAAAVKGGTADVTEGAEEVAKTIANSIPTKTLSL